MSAQVTYEAPWDRHDLLCEVDLSPNLYNPYISDNFWLPALPAIKAQNA